MQKIVQKLSSRKLWACVAGFVAGLAVVFGLDNDTITSVSGAVVAGASVVAYIYGEAKVDAANVASNTTHTETKETTSISKAE